jgi:site-specific DNA-methyltransferase (adenine-specific)
MSESHPAVYQEDRIIAQLDAARAMLAGATDATGAKRVADLARAAEVYARRQKLSQECISHATEVRVDAMTLLGEHLKAAGPQGADSTRRGESVNGHLKGRVKVVPDGISYNESSEAQALADLHEQEPALYEKVRAGEMSVPKARQERARRQRQERRFRKFHELKVDDEEGRACWEIVHGDALEELPRAGRPRLIFADPPYNIGVDYGAGERADRRSPDDYLAWVAHWLDLCREALTSDGTLWVLISDEYAAEYALLLKKRFALRSWVKWYETFGVNCSGKFNRCSRHLFYCVKDPKNFAFNPEAVTRPSARQAKYNDGRANPEGKLWDDVWIIPRLVGTAAERLPEFPTQLPLALLEPIVASCSEWGDLVVDPFSGSGTTGIAALSLLRRYLGIEKDEKFARLSTLRLQRGPS